MNRKGVAQVGLVIIIIILFLLLSGTINLNTIATYLKHGTGGNVYLTNIIQEKTPLTVKFTVIIKNPFNEVLCSFLDIQYDNTLFYTENKYIRDNKEIPIRFMKYGEEEVYTVEFLRKNRGIDYSSEFTFSLFDCDSKIIGKRVVNYNER